LGVERAGWHTSPFRPSIHGFKFANRWPVGTTVRTIDQRITTLGIGDAYNGLRGGMGFASLNHCQNSLDPGELQNNHQLLAWGYGVGVNPPDLRPVHGFIPMAYQTVTPPAIV
jgi:hypothetical protein